MQIKFNGPELGIQPFLRQPRTLRPLASLPLQVAPARGRTRACAGPAGASGMLILISSATTESDSAPLRSKKTRSVDLASRDLTKAHQLPMTLVQQVNPFLTISGLAFHYVLGLIFAALICASVRFPLGGTRWPQGKLHEDFIHIHLYIELSRGSCPCTQQAESLILGR